MTFQMNFVCVGNKHTTEFNNFDPFKLSPDELVTLCYMLHRTYEAISKIADYAEIYEEIKNNELEV